MDDLANRWWKPGNLLAACDRISAAMDDIRHRHAKLLREAMVTARFADMRPWNRDWEVWLTPQNEEFPDFKLRSGNEIRWFEQAEARYPSLGEEEADTNWVIRGEDPAEHFQEGMAVVEQRIANKAAKGYRPKPNLLIYGNFWSGDVRQHEAEQIMLPYRHSFDSVWLLFSGEAIRLWPNPCRIKNRPQSD
ncbi:MAG TPA: hypothetical protein VIH18_28140 [Candidatus Binatia bacterium]|jgi:hypothetical protein